MVNQEDSEFQLSEVVAESIATADLATKSDLTAVKVELKNDIAALDQRMTAGFRDVDQRMTAGFRDVEQRMTIKLGGMMMAMAAIIIAAIKYLPPGH